MHAKWMRRWRMVAVILLLAPLMAVAQSRPREVRPYSSSDGARGSYGEIQAVNDLRDEVSLSMLSENRELLGEWSIRPGEKVVLQDRGERIRVRPNDKIKMGDDGEWVDVGQVGQFQDGVWRVDVRDIWAATQQDRPVGRDSKREEATPRESSPSSPLGEILKGLK
jgi:hypothetical protein